MADSTTCGVSADAQEELGADIQAAGLQRHSNHPGHDRGSKPQGASAMRCSICKVKEAWPVHYSSAFMLSDLHSSIKELPLRVRPIMHEACPANSCLTGAVTAQFSAIGITKIFLPSCSGAPLMEVGVTQQTLAHFYAAHWRFQMDFFCLATRLKSHPQQPNSSESADSHGGTLHRIRKCSQHITWRCLVINIRHSDSPQISREAFCVLRPQISDATCNLIVDLLTPNLPRANDRTCPAKTPG